MFCEFYIENRVPYYFCLLYNRMDQTMNHLLTKHTPVREEVEGNPWDAIPIKNHKQAK